LAISAVKDTEIPLFLEETGGFFAHSRIIILSVPLENGVLFDIIVDRNVSNQRREEGKGGRPP